MQDDGVGIEPIELGDVLRTAFHVARAHPSVDPRPSSNGTLDPIGSDNDAGTYRRRDIAARVVNGNEPSVAVSPHPDGFDASAYVGARSGRLGGDRLLEAGAVEDEPDVTLRNSHFAVVRRSKYD